MKDLGYVRGELSNENLIKALLLDFALLFFLFLFLKLTIGDIEVPILGEVPSVLLSTTRHGYIVWESSKQVN